MLLWFHFFLNGKKKTTYIFYILYTNIFFYSFQKHYLSIYLLIRDWDTLVGKSFSSIWSYYYFFTRKVASEQVSWHSGALDCHWFLMENYLHLFHVKKNYYVLSTPNDLLDWVSFCFRFLSHYLWCFLVILDISHLNLGFVITFQIQQKYKGATGYLPIIFEGSSPGAGKFGYLKIRRLT